MKKQKKMAMETTPNAAPTTTTTTTTTTTSSKKKKGTKREVETRQTLVAVVAEEEKASHGGERAEGSFPVAETAVVEGEEDWREWWRPEVLVDEQMSWGSVWFSFWEQENGNCDHAFYSDVMEEDDIWDLRSIKQVPP